MGKLPKCKIENGILLTGQNIKKLLFDVAQNIEGILTTPIPLTISYDDFFITYGLKFYIEDFEDQLFKEAELHQLNIPFPITEVKILKNES